MKKNNTKKYLTVFVLLMGFFIIFSLLRNGSLLGNLTLGTLLRRLFPVEPTGQSNREWINDAKWTIPSSNLQLGEVVGYRTYAQDTSGNWNSCDVRYFSVQGQTITTTSTTMSTTTTISVVGTSTTRGITTTTFKKKTTTTTGDNSGTKDRRFRFREFISQIFERLSRRKLPKVEVPKKIPRSICKFLPWLSRC